MRMSPNLLNAMSARPANAGLRSTTGRSFIADVDVVHGPTEVLGPFLLRAEQAVADRGVFLAFASFDELAEANRANRSSWDKLVPIFDPNECRIDPATSLCILGRNVNGAVVAASAARLFDLGGNSLKDAGESLQLFFPDKTAEERSDYDCTLDAPSAALIRGKVIYSGATWFHPDYRRFGLAKLVPKLSRTAAATRWGASHMFSFVNAELIERRIPQAYGYTKLEWGLELNKGDEQIYKGALIWMDAAELYESLARFTDQLASQIDVAAVERRG